MNISKLFLVCSLALILTGCSDGKKGTPAPARPAALVTTTKAELRDLPSLLSAIGTVEPSATVTLVSRIPGELLEVRVKEGEYVKEGQLLFVIDKRQMQITLNQVQAQMESNRAKLAKAEEDLARSSQLAKGGFTSASQNDEVRVLAISLRAAAKADDAALEQAKLNLSYCEIKAPIAGRAGRVRVDKGNFIPALSTPLLTIDATQPVNVTFSVPERHLAALRRSNENTPMQVTAQARDGKPVVGLLTFVGNVDTTTGTVPLKANFPNETGDLWPGQYVDISLQLALLKDSITLPSRAVILGPNGTFVYVVGPDMKAHYRLVSTGVETQGVTVITKGLEAGEQVVLEGHVRLADGVPVRLPEASGKPEPADGGNAPAKPASPAATRNGAAS